VLGGAEGVHWGIARRLIRGMNQRAVASTPAHPIVLLRETPAVADRLASARRTARASFTVTPTAYPSPARRPRPLSRVSSVKCALALLFL
jgi:hypothetical protein